MPLLAVVIAVFRHLREAPLAVDERIEEPRFFRVERERFFDQFLDRFSERFRLVTPTSICGSRVLDARMCAWRVQFARRIQ